MTKETVGKIAVGLMAKEPETRSPIELERAMHSEYVENVYICLDEAKKRYSAKEFFIVVETKREKLLPNVFRHMFLSRLSCPTPNYDQCVYLYNRADDKISLLWVLPSRDASFLLMENAFRIDPSEKELLGYVMDFADGELFKLAKKLNHEHIDSNELVK